MGTSTCFCMPANIHKFTKCHHPYVQQQVRSKLLKSKYHWVHSITVQLFLINSSLHKVTGESKLYCITWLYKDTKLSLPRHHTLAKFLTTFLKWLLSLLLCHYLGVGAGVWSIHDVFQVESFLSNVNVPSWLTFLQNFYLSLPCWSGERGGKTFQKRNR